MEICAGYLTLSGAVEPKRLSIAAGAKRYILDNFREKILIKDICREQSCSKSTLLTAFVREYGKTVNEYITEIRLDEAARLTAMTDMTFYEIATAVGFSDQSYFSKVFSAKYGISPGKYRKLSKR
jgi:AraC-like DNA-binding protein